MDGESLKYIRLNEFWRFTEWAIKNSEEAWRIFDFLFRDEDTDNIIKSLTYIVENEFFYLLPILYFKMNEVYIGNDIIKEILFKELSPHFKDPAKFENICVEIICAMKERLKTVNL